MNGQSDLYYPLVADKNRGSSNFHLVGFKKPSFLFILSIFKVEADIIYKCIYINVYIYTYMVYIYIYINEIEVSGGSMYRPSQNLRSLFSSRAEK